MPQKVTYKIILSNFRWRSKPPL